ncbi:MAG TPA: hypothetical protein PKB03_04620, partial [Baekduia sp.]|nr:hypothetical protein [Baekduia sp.]
MQSHRTRGARMERTRYPGVYRRGSKYVVTWRHRGRQHKQTYPTLAAARDAKRERMAGATQPNSSRLTLGVYAREWLETYNGRTGQGIADTTRQDYRRSLETYVLPTLGTVRLSHIEPRDFRALVRSLEERGMRPSSVAKNAGALKTLLFTAVEDGLIPSNPAAVVRVASRRAGEFDDPSRRKALKRSELRRLLDAVDEDSRFLLEFLVFTGLRIGCIVAFLSILGSEQIAGLRGIGTRISRLGEGMNMVE